jgi:hypothetical protein
MVVPPHELPVPPRGVLLARGQVVDAGNDTRELIADHHVGAPGEIPLGTSPWRSAPMRHRGTCFELIGMQPRDHVAWVFDGPEQFCELVRPFLAEGAARAELLMLVGEDPDPTAVGDLVESCPDGAFQVASVSEVYGSTGIVDPNAQRATFSGVLSEAMAEGFSGIRVAADNSSLVLDEERLSAWMDWECVADRFMSENPVTGLCAFDRSRVDMSQLRDLAALHPLVSATAPTPLFRLFVDEEALWVDGLLDTFATRRIQRALEVLSPKTPLVVPLDRVTMANDLVFLELVGLSDREIDVTFRGPADMVAAARSSMTTEREHLHFVAA